MRKDTILCGGYAQFPSGMTGREIYKILGIGLEIDPKTGEILDVASTFLSEMTQEFLRSVLIGHNINNTLDAPIEVIKRRYFAKGKKAVISALCDAYNSYQNYLNNVFEL